MKKLLTALGAFALAGVLLFAVSSRSVRELLGYAQATADHTVEGLAEAVPNSIRDKKLQNDIETARGEIIDRRVQLNLANTQIRRMQTEIADLTGAVGRRNTILSDAYPALQEASDDRLTEVSFAGQNWLPVKLGAEVDRLLMEQDRDERQLEIRREALDRLLNSVEEGSAAIAQMESRLLEAENEFQTLVVRREQAHNENELLDLVASAGRTGETAAAQIGSALDNLRTDVESREARNEARRDTGPVGTRQPSQLTQAWSRLDKLKALHNAKQEKLADSEARDSREESATQTTKNAEQTNTEKSDSRDVIIVVKDAQVKKSNAGDKE